MNILITGFEPFAQDRINPSQELMDVLDNEIGGAGIIKAVLPTAAHRAEKMIAELIDTHEPDAVISFGLAGERKGVTVERIGINVDDFRIPDNDGCQPRDTKIDEDGPDGCFSTLDVKAVAESIRKAGIEASVSNTAGTFVCNHILYFTLLYCRRHHPDTVSGFIHLPYLDTMVTEPAAASMTLEEIKTAAEAAVFAVIHSRW